MNAPAVGSYSVEVRSPFLTVRSDPAELTLATGTSEEWVRRLPETPGSDYTASCYADGFFVIGGLSGTVALSSDGTTWDFTKIPEAFDTYHVGHVGSNWVFVGSRENIGGIFAYLTADFVSWNRVLVGQGSAWSSVFATDGQTAIISGSSLYRSEDGVTWSEIDAGPGTLSGAAWANGRFMAITDHPAGKGIHTSADGETTAFPGNSCRQITRNRPPSQRTGSSFRTTTLGPVRARY
jgi:hypothetical protein